ncbi:hypothetical protein RHGRI_032018 [Rhododendron griersonianum]|uniref:Uncharacterized protein n=1 Tax=Rhododendron griersonianum TaxID=479676 RepID=A0AAV6IAP1_9ERIC|nr:hypothetical protein RHGRI_032018 [Rhododendron griersonianum]
MQFCGLCGRQGMISFSGILRQIWMMWWILSSFAWLFGSKEHATYLSTLLKISKPPQLD